MTMAPERVPAPVPAPVVVPSAAAVPAARAPLRGSMRALPGVLRIGGGVVAHAAGWSAVAYVRTTARLAKAAVDPREAAVLSDELSMVAGQLTEFAKTIAKGGPISEAVERWGLPALERARALLEHEEARPGVAALAELRREGEALLRRSRDVWADEQRHPAYAGILRDLAPDEARILVLLLKDGPQPAVDVRLGGAAGRLKSERTLARGLTMIGPRSSVRYPESVPQYLNNLTRLGLVWQSPEPIGDLLRYQVIEAQPDVLDAVHAVRTAKVIRRSIHLTPFGQDFARVCFAEAEELAALPQHEAPPEAIE
ncbi:Abi-alpha family protein [Nocardioides nematodiphilus]|uniref:Abi-alpha family protein n=1 Tax=Nocardioides nematodiphilus TaxID=2849669 RepID=UPI001CD97070|nr:Abi-alpha family protein [Nocardioides nematodiphilus]MCA1983334.1 DUF4393 domain-containing protein [Nocardioides nematodiphilus]